MKRSRKLKSIVVVVGLAGLMSTSRAYGASHYVSNSGSPACSNSASFGSEAQPWCTITYGISRLSGGDDLFVKQGTYNEEFTITGPNGSATKNTVIRTFPGDTVTIRGSGNSGRVSITGAKYITLDGFIITNFNQAVFVNGASDHIIVQNITAHDVGQEGIHVKEASSFVTIQNSTVYNTMKLGGCCNGEGIYVGSSTTAPADQWTHDVTIRNNVIHDTTSEGVELKPGTYNCIVDGNTFYNTNINDHYAAVEVNERDNAPQGWTANPNHVVRNNTIHDNYNGIRLGTGSSAYNNVIWNTASGYSAITYDNISGDSFTRFIYHNTVVDGGISGGGGTIDKRNNIGTTGTNDLAFSAAYFVNAAGRDYHLVIGASPVNVGANLTSMVPLDKDGKARVGQPDLGAYEYNTSTGTAPTAPVNLKIQS